MDIEVDTVQQSVVSSAVDDTDGNEACAAMQTSDDTDARKGLFSFGRPKEAEMGTLTVPVESLDYNMSHKSRGRCIIFNHKIFNQTTKCRERKGTEIDGQALFDTFKSLNFAVEEHKDPTQSEVLSIIAKASEMDYTDVDCFACCILTHGEQGYLWAKDRQYAIDTLFSYFKGDKCPSLAGKPKMFYIQACQGDKLDPGVKVITYSDVADSAACYRIPTWADFLIVHSTVPGYYAWRNTSCGSWFIQSLVSTFREYASQLDLLSMLTIVNRKVAYCFESCVPNDSEFDKKKQVSCVTSMLTRRVFFFPKVDKK